MKNRPLNTNLQTPKRQLLDYASVTSQHPPKTNAHPNTGMISPYTHIRRQNPTNPHQIPDNQVALYQSNLGLQIHHDLHPTTTRWSALHSARLPPTETQACRLNRSADRHWDVKKEDTSETSSLDGTSSLLFPCPELLLVNPMRVFKLEILPSSFPTLWNGRHTGMPPILITHTL